MTSHVPAAGQRGFTLLEVLVAMVVLSLGAMGVMGLVLHAQQANEQALQRGRATLLVNDMIERMRANATLTALSRYNVGESATAPIGAGQQQSDSDCRIASCSSTAMAQFDLADWERQISQAQADGKTIADGLPEARACITVTTKNAAREVSVTLAWRGTGAGSANNSCASTDIAAARQSITATSRYVVSG